MTPSDLGPVTSYGPAQERRTRTPIRYQDLPKGEEGEYNVPKPSSILDALPILLQSPNLLQAVLSKGLIQVDPSQSTPTTLKHEATHAALLQSPIADKITQLATQIPGFGILSNALKGRGGNMQDEVSAYAAENDPKMNLPQDTRNSYINSLVQQLTRLDPGTAQKYQRLSQ